MKNSLAAILLCLLPAAAQTLPFKNYTTADGLGHDFVGRIVRDSRGFLWFCTGEGLSRFDGYEFKNYTQADGLPHRTINDLLELEDGKYLVATGDGLVVFDPQGISAAAKPSGGETPMFRAFRSTDPFFARQPFIINSLYQKRDGQIFVLTFGRLFRLVRQGDDWDFQKVEVEEWNGKNIEILSMIEDRRGKVWLTTGSGGVWLLDETAGRAVQLTTDSVPRLLEDREGRIWAGIGDMSLGLSLYTYPAGEDKPVLTRRFTTRDGLTDDRWINAVFETSDGRILAGVRNGVCEFQPDAKTSEPAFRVISTASVASIGEDGGGNIWLGTGDRGAVKLTRRGFVFYRIPEKQPYVTVSSIFTTSDGELYVTSSNADLLRFDGRKFSEIKPKGLENRSWGWNQLDLRSRVDGEWWIPSSTGLLRYPAVAGFEDLQNKPPRKIYTKADGLIAEDIFRLFEDSRGDLWFSTISKAGVMRWNRKTDKIQLFTAAEGAPDHSSPTAYGEDGAGNVWIGFYTGGVMRFRDGKIEFFPAPDRFPAGLVNAIHADKNGRLWVAVSNSGLIRVENYAADEPDFIKISVAEGLSSNQANCITEDDFGRIYVGTARGINRLDPATGRIKVYTQADGLPGATISRCARDGQGNLWFSQRFTIAKLTPETETRGAPPPPIYISGLRANGESVRRLSELGETSVENVEFATDQRQIQIGFFALGFGTGESLRYQYKLDNADWSEPGAQRSVDLNLAPGSYRFLVRAVNSEGAASLVPASVVFSISPPLWQRWWFLTALAVLIGLIIYAVYNYRLRRLLELERVRTRIATDLHDDIGSSLSQIAILSEVARQKVGADGAGKSLNMIAETSREMIDSMSDIVWAINPQKDHLGDLVQRMRRFADDALSAKDIALELRAPETGRDLALGADLRREIYLIFKETINNLVKHAECSRVEIDIELTGDRLKFTVSDNGKGFDAEKVFDESLESLGGNGLINMRKRAAALGGRLTINSAPGTGTQIILEAPVGKRRIWRVH